MHPITRLCVGFIMGVFLAPHLSVPAAWWAGVGLIAWCLSLPLGGLLGWRGAVASLCLGAYACASLPHGPTLRGEVALLGRRVGAPMGRTGDVEVSRWAYLGAPWAPSSGRVRVRFGGPAPVAGQEVLLRGVATELGSSLPGAPDPVVAAARVGVDTLVRARATRLVGVVPPGPRRVRDPTGLLTAVARGDRSGVAPQVIELLRRTGTSHLLAISGFHVGSLAALVVFVVGRLRRAVALWVPCGLPQGLELGVGVLAAWSYAWAAGAPLSAQRAAGLLALLALGRWLGRRAQVEPLLAVVAVAVLWVDPASLATPSFQLSFGAVLGLLRVTPVLLARVPEGLPWPVAWLVSGSAATLAATAGTLPAAAWWFQGVAPSSVVANLVALPAFSFGVVPLGALACFGPEVLSGPSAWLGSQVATWILWMLAPLSWAPWTPAVGPVGAGLLWLALVWARQVQLCVVLVLAALGLRPVPRAMTLTFLDVGQGDATLVEFPDGERWLVDGGPSRGAVVSWLRRRGVRHLDVVVATHNQTDHVAGLYAVIDELRVDELWITDVGGLAPLITTARARGVAVIRGPFDALHPAEGFQGAPNDRSLVLSVGPALLTGDVEGAGEREVVARVAPHAVLKVPHHGSSTSSSPALLDAVSPRLAVVSAGRGNRFGHPRAEVLERYALRGVEVLRTDVDGTVLVRGDQGQAVWTYLAGVGWRPWAPEERPSVAHR